MVKYTLAVDHRYHGSNSTASDFVNCVVYGKGAEFAMKWLKDKINWISEADTDQKRKVRITKLRNSIAVIDSLTTAESAFSGYALWFIQQCPEYQEAKRIMESR